MGKKLKRQELDQDFVVYAQKGRTIANKDIATGSWTIQENEIYLKFLKTHKKLFNCEYVRRSTRAFSKLAVKLKRTSEQCRSHHQKFEVKGDNDIESLIERVQGRIEELKYKQELQSIKKGSNKMSGCLRTGETLHLQQPLYKNPEFEVYKNQNHFFYVKLNSLTIQEY